MPYCWLKGWFIRKRLVIRTLATFGLLYSLVFLNSSDYNGGFSDTTHRRCRRDELADALVLDFVDRNKFLSLGGTGHWFHNTERILTLWGSQQLQQSFDSLQHEEIASQKNNRSILILFRHQIAAERIDPFGRLLLAAVVSNGTRLYNSVVFGFLKPRYNVDDYQKGDMLSDNSFISTFHTNFEKQISRVRFVRSFNVPIIRCAKLVAKLTVEAPLKKYEWFSSNATLFLTFRKAVSKTCDISQTPSQLALSSSDVPLLHYNASICGDDLNTGDALFVEKIKRLAWSQKLAGLPLSPAPAVTFPNPAQPLTLLIYQRDKSRRIVNVDDTVRVLRSLLGRQWRIEVMVHDNERSPCTLLRKIGEASALLTPHGFQSTSMLFQPLHSALIEVHPALFSRPEVYGYVQAGLRQSFGIARSYLTEESVATTELGKAAVMLLASVGVGNDRCLHNPACRFLSRLQDVRVSRPFIERIANFLNTHFKYIESL